MLTELGFETNSTPDQVKELITQEWILKNVDKLFDNVDANLLLKEEVISVNKSITSSDLVDEVYVSIKVKDITLNFKVKGFIKKEDNIQLRNQSKFEASEFGFENKTAEEAKNDIESNAIEWTKNNLETIFFDANETLSNKIKTVKTHVIGNHVFVVFSDFPDTTNNSGFLQIEIYGFKELVLDVPTQPDNNNVQISPNIDLDSNNFIGLKNKTSQDAEGIINEKWLFDNQKQVFGTTSILESSIKIIKKGPEANFFRLSVTINDKSILISIRNFVTSISLVKQSFETNELGFNSDIKPSIAITSVNSNLIWANRFKIFKVIGAFAIEDIKQVSANVVADSIDVKLSILGKEFTFKINGFNGKYIDLKKSEFYLSVNKEDQNNGKLWLPEEWQSVKGILDNIKDTTKAKGFITENKNVLFTSYGLQVGETDIQEVKAKMIGNGSVQITVTFTNNIEKVVFKVIGLKQDVAYIGNIKATTIPTKGIFGMGLLYKFRFVITGSNLPTSKFVNNFSVRRVSRKSDGTFTYSNDLYKGYWGYVKGVSQTSERIEVEITKGGKWKPGEIMIIHIKGRDMSEGFQLTLPVV